MQIRSAGKHAGKWMMLGLAVGLTGCYTTHVVPRLQAPDNLRSADVETLESALNARYAAIQTLTAQVLITASTGGSREGQVKEYTSFRGYIFVRKPRDLRVILQLPVLGSRAMDMVSNGTTFKLLIPPRSKAIEGTNTAPPTQKGLDSLRPPVFFDSLLIDSLQPHEFVTLTESTHEVQPADRHHAAIVEPDYDLTVLKLREGNVMERERTIHISRINLLPFQQDIYDNKGQIVTQASYANYQMADGQPFPMSINIRRPLDEYALKIDVTKVALNEKLEDDQFELKIPADVTVQKMP